MSELNSCNCCEGVSVETPVEITNRQGLNAIAYRVGTHPTFRESLLARISLSGKLALQNLTTRENNDFSIALLDGWSVVADILTFYQERIANESYLRTATERRSVLEMSRLVGYEPGQGVAASAYLSFTLEDSPAPLGPISGKSSSANAKEGLPPINIAKGTKVQSIPGPDEVPQIFETLEDIESRAEWNAIKPRLSQPIVKTDEEVLVFRGITNNLNIGDILFIPAAVKYKLKKILKVTIDTEAKTTWVYFNLTAVPPAFIRPTNITAGDIETLLTTAGLDENIATEIVNKTWPEEDLAMLIKANKWSSFELVSSMSKMIVSQTAIADGSVYVFRKRAFVFGYNAPQKLTLSTLGVPSFSEWLSTSESAGKIYLDSNYDEILPETFIAVQKDANIASISPDVYEIKTAEVRSRTAYGISTKTTEITFNPKSDGQFWWNVSSLNNFSDIRPVTIYAQSEKLSLGEFPVIDVVQGNTITLNRYYPGLVVGQVLIITGDRNDLKGVTASEVIKIKEVVVEKGFTVIELLEALDYSYVRTSVSINANVAIASNGEATQETLGSGDAGQPFQQFTLRQPPLTYISASTDTGTLSTLEVRVNDILWHEVEYFLDHLPNERIYITRRNDDGKTTVTFGDGNTGARLPTGQENVKVKYRKGIGLNAMVKANQLSQLLTRPLGVKEVVNPVAATGAADPEVLENARINAPLGILTLGRIVSLQDYEDFARAFAGIEKALATWTWVSERRHIFITVAGAGGKEIEKDGLLYDNLLKAIRKQGDPQVSLTLESYIPRFFRIKANIQVDSDYINEDVFAEIEDGLRETFSFKNRQFGQAVNYSEVISVIQQVEGVVAVDIDKLYRSDLPEDITYRIQASMPVSGDGNILAAELITLDQRPVDLKIMI